MAKKINPIIYRIGTKNDWALKFIEKKQIEYKTFSFNSIEISEFLKTYFFYNGLSVVFDKLFLSRNLVHIFVVYDYSNIYSSLKGHKDALYFENIVQKSPHHLSKLKKVYNSKLKHFLKKKNNNKIIKSTKILSSYFGNHQNIFIKNSLVRCNVFAYLRFLKTKYNTNLNNLLVNLFLNKLIFSIQLYFKNKVSIFLTLKQIIKNSFLLNCTRTDKKTLVLDLVKVRKFEKNEFFFKVVNTIHRSKNVNKKAYLLADFLQSALSQVKKLKSTNAFLYFFKSVIKYFLKKYNHIKGLKIVINGNLSKKRRSIKKTIKIGYNVNCLKLNSQLDYGESTCYTKKGTFGIKIYVQ